MKKKLKNFKQILVQITFSMIFWFLVVVELAFFQLGALFSQ